jgi:hypothetical protein
MTRPQSRGRERTGFRDQAYSVWHSIPSISRFMTADEARLLCSIDIDKTVWVEYDFNAKEPLILIETAIDQNQGLYGNPYKSSTILTRLAVRASALSTVVCAVVMYTHSDQPNPVNDSVLDIVQFRVEVTHPKPEGAKFVVMTPEQYAQWLLKTRAFAIAELRKVMRWEE